MTDGSRDRPASDRDDSALAEAVTLAAPTSGLAAHAEAPTLDSGSGPIGLRSSGAPRPLPIGEPPVGGSAASRYEHAGLLGVGGMGEVHLCEDRTIARSVALKLLDRRHAQNGTMRERFLLEARVQGGLEHPSVPPVYDLFQDETGVDCFTMKRVSGTTLEEIIARLAARDAAAREQFPLGRLLEMFAQLCLAVDCAHSGGVVHRDLKPSNVMIGEFGEVYVLDWGLAKVTAPGARRQELTLQGQILGTPGYMPPEQMLAPDIVDERGDVYSLGAILFELLALEPLHPGETVQQRMQTTQSGTDASARLLAAELGVPPELVAVCVAATAIAPSARPDGAGELARAIERYLEGDRDIELRRELARQHAAEAERALQAGQELRRDEALQAAGRALALDPESPVALGVLTRLLLDVPAELPAEVEAERAQWLNDEARSSARAGVWAYGVSLLLMMPMLSGARSFGWAAVGCAALLLAIGVCAVSGGARHYSLAGRATSLLVVACLTSLAIASASGLFGPLVLVPALATANTLALSLGTARKYGSIILGLGCAAVLVPSLLEWTGVLPQVYEFRDGAIVIHSAVVEFRVPPVGLIASSLILVAVPALVVWRFEAQLVALRRRLYLELWHLSQLVPGSPLRPEQEPGETRRAP
jgi:eukaryotic-like serine/threonine-protein kinase